ncbi:MAG: hypothetical protein ACLSWI_04435 [Candidatus Gastranaerophilaceae bacterium]
MPRRSCNKFRSLNAMPEWKVTSSPRNDLPAFTLAEGGGLRT